MNQLGLFTPFAVAPNTLRINITREGPYHSASVGADTVSGNDYQAATCRRCKNVAGPAHVTDSGDALAVWCADHCPACIAFRKSIDRAESLSSE